MKFADAVNVKSSRGLSNKTKTTNGMPAKISTLNYCTDLFFKIGASRNRGQNVVNDFNNAFLENPDLALRIAAWARDIRGGAGERKVFRDIMLWLEENSQGDLNRLLPLVPEIGRWDDLLIFRTPGMRQEAYQMVQMALIGGNGLAAKWMPRKGPIANELREFMGMSPKTYRKTLVHLTEVVETAMCSGNWNSINFSQVPSVASARYKKAFNRNTPKYAQYVDALVSGEAGVKVNANAIFPHDVLKGAIAWYTRTYSAIELNFIQEQWNSLPNYLEGQKILPLVDVSGSMDCPVGGNPNLRCIDIAVSLGLYMADKNVGQFKDVFMTFSGSPSLVTLVGNIIQKINKMVNSDWKMNTNLEAAFNTILSTAVRGNVSQEDMPDYLVIFSDMQFDRCVSGGSDTAMKMIRKKFDKAGYVAPRVVFWNLNAHDNVPVKFTDSGVALVSGFSPAVMKSVLAGDAENFTPECHAVYCNGGSV